MTNLTQNGSKLIMSIIDQNVGYSEDFSVHITTTLPNPHYKSGISIAATIIYFTIAPAGLDEQLLAETVRIEKPKPEIQRNPITVQITVDVNDTGFVQDDTLQLHLSIYGSILDYQTVSKTLEQIYRNCKGNKYIVQATEETATLINSALNQY
ncbi:MAG: putative dynein heavy chain [Streblomastix strix]|uniref:Putative dynein heavy chain n=1 Tax=Streblomastix strix TaxID=222440 RepID=A0A5J4V020_9EUKA|nr:MAG: putative dynein heavy chain [Streblomastix strix]